MLYECWVSTMFLGVNFGFDSATYLEENVAKIKYWDRQALIQDKKWSHPRKVQAYGG